MRLPFTFLVCLQLFFVPSVFAQGRDTTAVISSTDSARQLVKQEFEQYQDSMQALRIKQNVAQNGKSLDAFLAEMKEKEKAHQRQVWFRIGTGLLFLVVLAVGLARRRKANT